MCRLICLLGVLLVLAGAGCKKGEEKKALAPGDLPPSAVVVSVDGAILTFGEMERRASGLHTNAIQREGIYYPPSMAQEAMAAFRKKAINDFVYKTLMLKEAARLGIAVNEQKQAAGLQRLVRALAQNNSTTNDYFSKGPYPPDVMRSDFHDNLVIDELFSQRAQRNIKVMDEDVERGVAAVEATNAVRRATLEAARKQILEGAPFEDVARTISEDTPTARQGGELREFARGRYEAAFEDAAFSLSVGQVSDVVETRHGYHIIKLLARNPAQAVADGIPPVPETVRAAHILLKAQPIDRSTIAAAVYREKFAEARLALYEELKAKAKIENALFPDMEYKAVTNTR